MTTSTKTLKFNIVEDDGEPSSVTVFLAGGGQLVATKEQKGFGNIIDRFRKEPVPTEQEAKALFNIGIAIGDKMKKVSERVVIRGNDVFFDNDRLAGPLVDAIIRFYEADVAGVDGTKTASGIESWKPLVAFLENVMQNPNEHSRSQLFRWLEKHHYAITDDGHFVAYKGVSSNGFSLHSGTAFVNGVKTTGYIPNVPGTVIEMPRSEVQFDPAVACHTGLHVGNYDYARSFSRERLLRCKVNPRDVVSVPTDAGDAKVRTCRYYVLDVVTAEDTSVLFAGSYKTVKLPVPVEVANVDDAKTDDKPKPERKGNAKAKPAKAAKKAAVAKVAEKKPEPVEETWPASYEDFTIADFRRLDFTEMRWLAKEWGITVPAPRGKVQYVDALNKEAKARLRRWTKENKGK